MKSKNPLELFDEFLSLSYDPVGLEKELYDLKLFPMVYLRKWEGKWTIHILPIGTRIMIPAPWPSMFSQFNVWGGGRVMDWIKENIKDWENFNPLLQFTITFYNFTRHIEREMCGSPEYEKIWEENMGNCMKIGTKLFRDWIKETHGEELKPWILENFENESKEI